MKTLAIKGYSSAVRAVAFAPDGLSLISGDANGKVLRWEVLTGKPNRVPMTGAIFGVSDVVQRIVYSPDGKRFAMSSRSEGTFGGNARYRVTLRNSETLREERTLVEGDYLGAYPVFGMAFAPDSDVVAVGVAPNAQPDDESHCMIWDAQSGRKLATIADLNSFPSLMAQ